jgi:hypothetical protein
MINDIQLAIVAKLKELFPDEVRKIRRHIDDIPQGFKKPAFVLFEVDQDYSKRLNTKYNGRITFDLAFFSDKPSQEIKSDCLVIQETFLRGFDYFGAFKALNKNAQITDNVLHMTFDVKYSELKTETSVPMQTQKINFKKG